MTSKKDKGIELLEEVLSNLENSKFTLFSIIQKLNRAAKLLNEKNLIIWTEIQLGNTIYTIPIKKWVDSYIENSNKKTKQSEKLLEEHNKKLKKLGIDFSGKQVTNEELTAKTTDSGGGFNNIGFIEERYNDIHKNKKGNDGVLYQSSLTTTLSVVKVETYRKASSYHAKYAYESLPSSNFEVLKENIEDTLFDLDPELAELLLLTFKSVSSDKPEEWSQALTSSRRFFEKLADGLYPASKEIISNRSLSKENYINRLWVFMDESIKSKTNKEIAKKHVDLIGSYLQSLYKMTNKGVHTNLNRFEAIKTVMHIYLLCGDLLDYLDKKQFLERKPNIHSATIDELEIIGEIPRKIAKEIIKLRIKNTLVTKDLLKKIPGIGEKTLKKLLDNVTIEQL